MPPIIPNPFPLPAPSLTGAPVAVSSAVFNLMANSGAVPMPAVAAESAPPGGQPTPNPVSPRMFFGAVQASGAGAATPGGWNIANPGTGLYTVQHNLGLGNHCVSVSCVGVTGPCGASVVAMDGNSFTVQVIDGSQNPVALPWSFTLSTVG